MLRKKDVEGLSCGFEVKIKFKFRLITFIPVMLYHNMNMVPAELTCFRYVQDLIFLVSKGNL